MTQGTKMRLVNAVAVAGLTLPTAGVAQQHMNSQGMMGQDPCYQSGSGHIMGQGMMNPGMMGQGMMAARVQNLTVAEVKQMIAGHLAWQGNPNLKVGAVEENGDRLIIAEIVTQDGSLVQRLQFDRTTGSMQPTR
jgi:hypothetical protein